MTARSRSSLPARFALTRTTSRRSSFVMPERRLLVHMPEAVQKELLDGRSAVDKRRFEREVELEAARERKFKGEAHDAAGRDCRSSNSITPIRYHHLRRASMQPRVRYAT